MGIKFSFVDGKLLHWCIFKPTWSTPKNVESVINKMMISTTLTATILDCFRWAGLVLHSHIPTMLMVHISHNFNVLQMKHLELTLAFPAAVMSIHSNCSMLITNHLGYHLGLRLQGHIHSHYQSQSLSSTKQDCVLWLLPADNAISYYSNIFYAGTSRLSSQEDTKLVFMSHISHIVSFMCYVDVVNCHYRLICISPTTLPTYHAHRMRHSACT